MKKIATILFAALFLAGSIRAQIGDHPGYVRVDSLVYTPVSATDENLEGRDILSVMPSSVNVRQSGALADSLGMQINRNRKKMLNGYRIRIFFDNKQNSRGASEAAEARFHSLYPGYGTYRSFANPFFKVTVGDFRSKTEAGAALQEIIKDFPSAFIVKEKIRYPLLDPTSYRVDTITVYRPLQAE